MQYSAYTYGKKTDSGYKISFTVRNHRNEIVYKTAKEVVPDSKYCETDEGILIYAAKYACEYFSRFIRSRYYDEHFATILDEDGLTVYSPCAAVSSPNSLPSAIYKEMEEYYIRPTIEFSTVSDKAEIFDNIDLLR